MEGVRKETLPRPLGIGWGVLIGVATVACQEPGPAEVVFLSEERPGGSISFLSQSHSSQLVREVKLDAAAETFNQKPKDTGPEGNFGHTARMLGPASAHSCSANRAGLSSLPPQ
jgi:hypothetical protein